MTDPITTRTPPATAMRPPTVSLASATPAPTADRCRAGGEDVPPSSALAASLSGRNQGRQDDHPNARVADDVREEPGQNHDRRKGGKYERRAQRGLREAFVHAYDSRCRAR